MKEMRHDIIERKTMIEKYKDLKNKAKKTKKKISYDFQVNN
jgi:hypothetical protein